MTSSKRVVSFPPRIIRLRDAACYLGMDRNRFNDEVRPYLTEVPIGAQGIGFDRLELDAWVDDYIAHNGRPAKKGKYKWDANSRLGSGDDRGSGTSKSKSEEGVFSAALEQVGLKKQKRSSQG